MSFIIDFFSTIPLKIPLSTLIQQAHNEDYDFGMHGRHEKPCRACSDFKSWIQNKNKQSPSDTIAIKNSSKQQRSDCPLDKDELGKNSWSLFHTISVHYPDKPTMEDQQLMKQFINGIARFYPCESCAKDFRADIETYPPNTESRKALTNWWCRIHNRVNKKLGKPEFDCSKLDQRWLDGWTDGSCD